MKNYQAPNQEMWLGRVSQAQLYLHEKVELASLKNFRKAEGNEVALLGYCCDAGIKRNQGRAGAMEGPDAIRKVMGGLSNHWDSSFKINDFGDLVCKGDDLETQQSETTTAVSALIKKGYFSIVLGGGHDLAYAHFKGIRRAFPEKSIGIINLDAHFDLREVSSRGTSGTPFWEIAQDETDFHYCCLGIQKAGNNCELFRTAKKLKVTHLSNTEFTLAHWARIQKSLLEFMARVDLIYLSIDLDGFSSAFAPGVSAPSPMGFQADVAMKTIAFLAQSQKLVSADVVELNPHYDRDNATSRLASSLIYQLMDDLKA
ncbi:formiminoglutamase [Pricia antarctica]|uniref:Formimidoylglutamase n=1 Tax=Pricia antarctica TaxID=641691 RepID=A0A1G6YET3_9FLAO|nr:formimidoylglutamase [Pricia antarctica]SDD88237.1 formiminoglutamase [Pricia antarctica]